MNMDKIRSDFEFLNKVIKGKPIIYMDSACVSLKPKQVVEAVNRYYLEMPVCEGRSNHSFGRSLTQEIENARKNIQKFLNASQSREIIFTKNTTEGINIIANSLDLKKGDSILTSDKEHNSGFLPYNILEKKGIKHKTFRFGDLGDFKKNLDKSVRLVSLAYVSNIDGSENPVEEIIKASHKNNSLVLIDAAQAVPHKEVNLKRLDTDFLVFSGHKALSPSGTGVLYGKLALLEKLNPFIVGGGTVKNSTYKEFEVEEVPKRFEAGLQDYAGIMGLSAAITYLQNIGMKNIEKYVDELTKFVSEELVKKGIKVLNYPSNKHGIISFNINGADPHVVSGLLGESANILVRSGMHCAHPWFNANKINGTVRVSLYFYNTKNECEKLIKEISKIQEVLT